jgi:hypothetical protein
MYSGVGKEYIAGYLYEFIDALEANNVEGFMNTLKIFFANIPYDIQISAERYYQTIFYLIFLMLGLRIQAEVKTNQGRADAVVETADRVYIFEFKLTESKESALAQIKEQKYYEPYLNKGKGIVLVGVEFNQQERNIGEWVEEHLAGTR